MIREWRRAGDWWTAGVAVVAVLHVALLLALRARPGRIAVALWNWGPPLLLAASAVLLGAALLSARRHHDTWSRRRAVGVAVLGAVVFTTALHRTYPSSYDGRPSAVAMRLPLDGPVTVAWGGPSPATNYHVRAPAERWGYDLLVAVDGRSYHGDGTALTDYLAYGLPVRAPAAGRVVAAHDGDPDQPPGRPDRARAGGNRVVLEVAPGEYLVIAHLQPGSVRVVRGQVVRQGEVVGRVGSSGNSSEPHVHLHLQDSPVPGRGEGIPFSFSDYVDVATGERVARGMPAGGVRRGRYVGDVVRAAE